MSADRCGGQCETRAPVAGVARAGDSLPGSRPQVIHSGHFMVSRPHGDSIYSDLEQQSLRAECPNSRSSEPSLSRLLECMSLAYSGKLVSPKWKQFKGLSLLWKDKIRLNNAIWRAWFTQYVQKRKNPVCGFITPLEGSEADEHRKPKAIVLEGNYWKRRIEVVIKEYHKWRIYFKKRLPKNRDDGLSSLVKQDVVTKNVQKWSSEDLQDSVSMEEVDPVLCDLDDLFSDISDTLFTTMEKTKPWPNAVYTSNADIIQPDLTPLQPNLDGLMDVQGFFSGPHHPHPANSFPEHSHLSNFPSNPFGPVTFTGPTENILHGNHHPQVDILSDPGFTLTINTAAISNQFFPGSTVSVDSQSVISGSKFQPPARYEQRPSHLLPESITAQSPCKSSYWNTILSAPSSAVISQQEPLPCPRPLLNPKYRSGTDVFPPVITDSAPSPFSQQCSAFTFPAAMMLSPSDTSPSSSATVPSVQLKPQTQQVTLTQVQSLHSVSKWKHKPTNPEEELFPSTVSSQSQDLIQLLSAEKQEDGRLAQFIVSCDLAPSPSSCLTSALSDFPGTTLMKPTEHVFLEPSAQSSTSPSVPYVYPKTERLSPSSSCSENIPSSSLPDHKCRSGKVSLNEPGEWGSVKQSTCSTTNRTRPQTNKSVTRQIVHISAEQKRRFNIKLGFDTLHSLVTSLDSQPAVKVSKATTLQKTAAYITKLQQEQTRTQEEAQRIREDIEKINTAINICQQQLPATGVPITQQRFRQMREMFDEYVRVRTLSNWKFWIFSFIIRPLFESFNGMVSTGSLDDLYQSALAWLDQHCSLPALRVICWDLSRI
ncbi:carbohydrate-responsive element-binding protein isoform X2 [Stegostoma tigrinum]|uniref:carbohydrate-responsive element-binding protein isoform X2 n=1 Tax=Stegostoma tigrinum TaxID=3053191 RepID=UPI002870226F|nr:carbohydrate-responsive element-binding protein isoform X2 [Stegostoma tigrinum]